VLAGGPGPADGPLARRIQADCLRGGLIVELGDRHGAVVRFLPPLIVTADQVDDIADRFAAAVKAAWLASGSSVGLVDSG
jgi:diaminobutyrate-2-oxoglutarate transaminase